MLTQKTAQNHVRFFDSAAFSTNIQCNSDMGLKTIGMCCNRGKSVQVRRPCLSEKWLKILAVTFCKCAHMLLQ